MTLKLLRDERSHIIGLVCLFGPRAIGAAVQEVHPPPRRLCESCLIWPAVVFCSGHIEYFCSECIPYHNIPGQCSYSSLRALAGMESVR